MANTQFQLCVCYLTVYEFPDENGEMKMDVLHTKYQKL